MGIKHGFQLPRWLLFRKWNCCWTDYWELCESVWKQLPFFQNTLDELPDWSMEDTLNGISLKHSYWAFSLSRFCSSFPVCIPKPAQNNLLNQTGSRCPALRFAWQGRRGRPQGGWPWLWHPLPCMTAARALSRLTEAPALSHATWQHPWQTLWQLAERPGAAARPSSVQAAPPTGWQGESLQRDSQLTQYSQGRTCSVTRAAHRGWTTEENLTLKILQNWHLHFSFTQSAGKVRVEQIPFLVNNLRTEN